MLPCFGVSEPLGQSKVNYVDIVLLFANSNKEIIRLDVSVKEMSGMDKFNSL